MDITREQEIRLEMKRLSSAQEERDAKIASLPIDTQYTLQNGLVQVANQNNDAERAQAESEAFVEAMREQDNLAAFEQAQVAQKQKQANNSEPEEKESPLEGAASAVETGKDAVKTIQEQATEVAIAQQAQASKKQAAKKAVKIMTVVVQQIKKKSQLMGELKQFHATSSTGKKRKIRSQVRRMVHSSVSFFAGSAREKAAEALLALVSSHASDQTPRPFQRQQEFQTIATSTRGFSAVYDAAGEEGCGFSRFASGSLQTKLLPYAVKLERMLHSSDSTDGEREQVAALYNCLDGVIGGKASPSSLGSLDDMGDGKLGKLYNDILQAAGLPSVEQEARFGMSAG